MNRISKIILLLTSPIVLESCAPRIVTQVTKNYPPYTTSQQVQVYEIGDTIPGTAEIIGEVKVMDNGFSTRCKYDQVVALAQQETAKNGGNALAITNHLKPSIKSSCHQIEGAMLRIEENAPKDTFIYIPEPTFEYTKKEPAHYKPHTFYVQAGYAFITSKFQLSPNLTGHPKNGPDWLIGYDWVSTHGLGAGVLYSGYKSSYSLTQAYIKGNILLSYFAPQFVTRSSFGKWNLSGRVGIGYFNYKETVKPQRLCLSGIGYNCMVGIEYTLSEYAGIGADFGYIGSTFREQEYMELQENEHAGIFRLHFDIGLRFHF